MPAERKYAVRITSGVIINGEGVHPDKKGGPIVQLSGYDARAVVSSKKGEYVDGDPASGPMSKGGEGAALVKKN